MFWLFFCFLLVFCLFFVLFLVVCVVFFCCFCWYIYFLFFGVLLDPNGPSVQEELVIKSTYSSVAKVLPLVIWELVGLLTKSFG